MRPKQIDVCRYCGETVSMLEASLVLHIKTNATWCHPSKLYNAEPANGILKLLSPINSLNNLCN